MVAEGEGWGWRGRLGLADANRMDKQQVLLYSTGNYTQYSVLNHNGKEHEKEYVCV